MLGQWLTFRADWPLRFLCFEVLKLQKFICSDFAIHTDSSVRSNSMITMLVASVLLLLVPFPSWNLRGSSAFWRWKARTSICCLHLALVSLLSFLPCVLICSSHSPQISVFHQCFVKERSVLFGEIEMSNDLLTLLASSFHGPWQI